MSEKQTLIKLITLISLLVDKTSSGQSSGRVEQIRNSNRKHIRNYAHI